MISNSKTCTNCKGFIPKKNKPYYIAGNVIGVCNFTENVTPLSKCIRKCEMWRSKAITEEQKKFIKPICEMLGIEFVGTSCADAITFIDKNKKNFYRQKGLLEKEQKNKEFQKV